MAQLYIKAAPHGMDIPVQKVQGIIYERLRSIWCTALSSDSAYRCYGRIEKVQVKGAGSIEYMPAATAINGEYDRALPDDSAKLVSFFGFDDTVENTEGWTKKINGHLVFFANTCALEENGYRADEEVRRKVFNVLHAIGWGFDFKQQVTGIENVLREYRGETIDRLYATDMAGSWQYFRFNFELVYDPNDY